MPNTGELDLVWDSGPIGLEVDIAIDGNGSTFATTSGGGLQVDVYQRAAAGARFSKIATLESPGNARSGAPTQPLTLAFDRSSSMRSFLAIVWSDPDGVTMIVSAFTVSQGSVTKQWVSKSCPSTSPGFNYVMQPGLAIVGVVSCGSGVVAAGLVL